MDDNFDDVFFEYIAVDLKSIKCGLKNLIYYSSMIYDIMFENMYELDRLRLSKRKSYDDCLKRLQVLMLKEQRVVENIGNDFISGDFFDYVDVFCDKYIDDEVERFYVKSRISNYFFDFEIEHDTFLDDSDKAEVLRYHHYRDDLLIEFLKSKKNIGKKKLRFLKYKYSLSFLLPSLCLELSCIGFNLNDLVLLDDSSKASMLDVDLETYQFEKLDFYREHADNMLNEFVSDEFPYTNDEILNDLDFLNFIVSKMSLEDLAVFRDDVKDELEDDHSRLLYGDVSVLNRVSNIVDKRIASLDEFCDFDNLSDDMDGFEMVSSVDKVSLNVIDSVFALVKQSSKTYDIAMKLCGLESLGKQDTHEFKSYLDCLCESVEMEKKIAGEISVDEDEMDAIINMIYSHINLVADVNPNGVLGLDYLGDFDSRSKVIGKRVLSLLSDLYFVDVSAYKNKCEPSMITNLFMVDVLKEFENVISSSDDKYLFTLTKYEQLISEAGLMDEFIVAGGKVLDMVSFDDETVATFFDIDVDEYQFDKSELLYNYVRIILDEITDSNDVKNEAVLSFLGSCVIVASRSILDDLVEVVYTDEVDSADLLFESDHSKVYKKG